MTKVGEMPLLKITLSILDILSSTYKDTKPLSYFVMILTYDNLFYFQVKLVEVEKVEWVNKKSYAAIGLTIVGRESRILLRGSIGLDDWFHLLEVCSQTVLWASSVTFMSFRWMCASPFSPYTNYSLTSPPPIS